MAKTRRKKAAPRAKAAKKKSASKTTKKSASSGTKMMRLGRQVPSGLDLKKLRSDIAKANDVLQKRLQGVDPESAKGKKLAETQSTITRWSFEIDGICSNDPGAEPCGDTMLITS